MTNSEKLNHILLIISSSLNIISTIVFWLSCGIIVSSLFLDDINVSYWIKSWLIPATIIQVLTSYLVDHYCKILNIKLNNE